MISSAHLKLYGRAARKALFRFLIIMITGWSLSIVCIIVSGFLFDFSQPGYAGANAGIIGALMAVVYLFITDFWASFLVFFTLMFMSLYFVAAKKNAMQVIVKGIWSNNADIALAQKIETYLQKIDQMQPGWLKKVNKPAEIITKLRELTQRDSASPRALRMVLNFLLKRIKLDGINLHDEKINVAKVVVEKIEGKMGAYAKPSLRFFLVLLFVHITVLILAVILH